MHVSKISLVHGQDLRPKRMSSRREDSDSEGSPEPETDVSNAFANDGSFLEMFKKRMEEQKRQEEKSEGVKAKTTSSTTGGVTKTSSSSSATKTASSALSGASGVQKASVNKPYQVVHSFHHIPHTM